MVTYIYEYEVFIEANHKGKWEPFTRMELDSASSAGAVGRQALDVVLEAYPELTGKLRISASNSIGRRELLRG